MSKIFQGDIGTKIRLDAGMNISLASILNIRYVKPDGTEGVWNATLEGPQYAYYIVVDGDLDQIGDWEVQLYVEIGGWKGHGEVAVFEVCKTIK